MIYLFGQVLILSYIDLFNSESNYELSVLDILITTLSLIFTNLNRLLIGIWFFLMADKFKQEKWSWFLIGLVFSQYSLIFLAILLITQSINTKVDLNKVLRPILILLIISVLLNPVSKFITTPYLTRFLTATDYGYLTIYSSYLSFVTLGIMILLNIVLASRLYKFIGQIQMKGKFLWAISTVFLGLFPVILFNEIVLIRSDE